MKSKKIFCYSLLFLFCFLSSSSIAANLTSPENAADFLYEKLVAADKIMPNEEISYLDYEVELNGEDCWEFSSQFNFNETGRYAVSKSGKIYEFADDNYTLISSAANKTSMPLAKTPEKKSEADYGNDNSDLLNFDGPEEQKPASNAGSASQSPKKFPMQRSTRGTRVNVRSEPDAESYSIAKLYEGTPIEVLAQRENWYQVRIPNGDVGWIFGDYIVNRLGKTGSHGGIYVWINTDDVHLRSKSSHKSKSILKLYEGHLVEAVENRGGWIKVFTRKGESGWVLGQYLMQVSF